MTDGDAPGRAPEAEPSLLTIVRGWTWAVPLLVVGIALRFVAVAGIHLYRYFDSAEYLTLDFSGRWRRPWTTPLLYELLPDDDASIVGAQALIGGISWLVLAFALAALFRRPAVQVGVAVATVALGCTATVTNWDATMLSEPMALSLTALVLAAWANLLRRPTTAAAVAVVAATVPWLFVRQSLVPTAWLTAALAVVLAGAALYRRRDARAAAPRIVLAVGLVAACGWASITYGRNTEILHHNLTAIVTDRVAPDAERLAWFVDAGMPMPADGRTDFGGFDEDPTFQDWVATDGTATYVRYLATHPWYAVVEPLPDFLGANRSYQEVPPFSEPATPPISMLAPAEPYGSSRTVLPGPVEDVLLSGGAVGSFLTGVAVALCWSFARRRDTDRRWWLPAATVVLAASALYAAWHGASTELPRLGLPAAVALRLALIVQLGLLAEIELDRRRPVARTADRAGAAAYPRTG